MAGRNLKEWALVAEVISAAAVVISLIFLAVQVREGASQTAMNTEAVQASALQQYFQQHADVTFVRVVNPELRGVISKARNGLESLLQEENEMFFPYASQQIRSFFVGYQMMQSGILPEDEWAPFEGALHRTLHRNQGYMDVWQARRQDYPESFRNLVDGLVERPSPNL